MRLVDVYSEQQRCYSTLWDLLAEREPDECISHRKMPSWDEHCRFVNRMPYQAWYLMRVGDEWVGAVYLTRSHEVGVSVLKKHRGNGYAEQAVREMLRVHPGTALANINPANEKSLALFRKLGFQGPIQVTLARTT